MKQFIREALKPAQIGVAFLCISGGVTILQLRPWLLGTAQKTEATVDMAGRAMTNLDAASKSLKKAAENESSYLNTTLPQLTEKIDGTIETTNRLLSSLDRSSDRIPDTLTRVNTVVDSANQVLISTKTDLDALKPVIDGLDPIEQQVTATIPYVRQTFINLNDLATSQDVKGTLANVKGMTKDMHSVTTDGAEYVHALTHPTKGHGTLFVLEQIWAQVKPHISIF